MICGGWVALAQLTNECGVRPNETQNSVIHVGDGKRDCIAMQLRAACFCHGNVQLPERTNLSFIFFHKGERKRYFPSFGTLAKGQGKKIYVR